MKVSRQLAVVIAALILQLPPAFADDVITNVMSPVVSYQYYDSVGEDTNAIVVSPIISYQYFDWPGNDVRNLQSSAVVSYYYELLDTPQLTIIPTNRTPTAAEITSLLAALPTPSRLLAYDGEVFTTNLALIDPNRMSLVLTHGWNSDPNAWGKGMAHLILTNLPNPKPNIMAWDWSIVAKSAVDDPGIPASQTSDQGRALGERLLQVLGPNYSKPIHFIGHSLGTLLNASSANYLHGDHWAQEDVSPSPWAGTNTQMTLFDEAEVATGQTGYLKAIETILDLNGNPLAAKPSYYHPLPKQFIWADNYVSAFGLLHSEAANVIYTNGFPMDAQNVTAFIGALATFHGYPMDWYNETIQTDISAMGFLWSFERAGSFSQAPSVGSVYMQTFNNSQWNLTATNWNYGTNFLNARFEKYRSALKSSAAQSVGNALTANGKVNGESQIAGPPYWIVNMSTTITNNPPVPQDRFRPLGKKPSGSSDSANVPAYVWITLVVPINAISLSFDYKIQGDWQNDLFAVAFNGTNILLTAGNEIQTNVTFSSGSINVSAFAGQTNECFMGIIGGTSTNAQLTIENLEFSISSPLSLEVQLCDSNLVVSWPLSADGYMLETTANLTITNSWTIVTNVPAIVNFRNVVTNDISGTSQFFRLKL